MDRFLAIDAFVRVAETQSFAPAARQMRCSRSVITSRIQQLETFVGAPLFHRDTRSVRLSELGQASLQDCVDLVGRTNEVVDQMHEVTASPAGRLRIHALPGFVLGHLAQVLQQFQVRYPQIVVEMIVNDVAIDPVKEGFDCAVQIFLPRSEKLVARKLFPVRRVLSATRDYLSRYGTPRHPRDLHGHRIATATSWAPSCKAASSPATPPPLWVTAAMAVAGLAHPVDLGRRWRRGRRGLPAAGPAAGQGAGPAAAQGSA